MKGSLCITLALGAALAACFAWYYSVYVYWQPKVYPFAVAAVTVVFALFSFYVVRTVGARAQVLWTIACVVVFAALLFGVSTILNNVLHNGLEPVLAANTSLPLCLAQTAVMLALLLRALGKDMGKKPLILTAAGLAAMFLLAGVIGTWLPAYLRRPSFKDLPYGTQSGRQVMDIYLPKEKGPADVVFFIHGGGWSAGEKEIYRDTCREYAQKGYVAAALNYRFLSPLPPEEQPAGYAEMLDDIDAAIATLKAKMLEKGYTPRKMAITGGSAGGHLTLLYGYSRYQQSPIPIAFLFPDVGPSDFNDPGYQDVAQGPAIVEAGRMLDKDSASDLKAPSPVTYVEPGVPPTLMRYGGVDDIVPPSQGTILKAALDAAGVRNDLFIYPNSWHDLAGPDEAVDAVYRAKLEEYFDTYFSQGTQAVAYGKKQYGGRPTELAIGEYTPKEIGKIASLRIPAGLRVKLYRSEQRGGGYLGLEEDQADLTQSGWFRDIVKIAVEEYAEDEPAVKNYNYVLGAQDFSPLYGFRDGNWTYEAAGEIYKLGSNVLKADMAEFKPILDDYDFTYIYLWVHTGDNIHTFDTEGVYDDVYRFTRELLTDYNGTGKTFYLGHWEGDWLLLGDYDASRQAVGEERIQGMINWLNTRQKAIDDAKRDTPHANVDVWGYTEANRTTDVAGGAERVANMVLPHTDVDYLSYSAYDIQGLSGEEIKAQIDYMNGMLPAKDGVPGPRVFIGEMAYSAESTRYSQAGHNEKNIESFIKFLDAGAGQVLYWQMYCNEARDDAKRPAKGHWLIDNRGVKWKLYYSFKAFYCNAKEYVRDCVAAHGEAPDAAAFRQWASAFLATLK